MLLAVKCSAIQSNGNSYHVYQILCAPVLVSIVLKQQTAIVDIVQDCLEMDYRIRLVLAVTAKIPRQPDVNANPT